MNEGSSSPVPPAAAPAPVDPSASAPAAAASPAAASPAAASPAAAAPAGPPAASLLEALRAASAGLLLPSESDAPIEAVELPGPPTAALLRELSGADAGAPVEATTVEAVLGPPGQLRPSQDDEERASAEAFQRLHTLVRERLASPAAHRVGATDVTVWITGQDEAGQWVGLRSRVVET